MDFDSALAWTKGFCLGASSLTMLASGSTVPYCSLAGWCLGSQFWFRRAGSRTWVSLCRVPSLVSQKVLNPPALWQVPGLEPHTLLRGVGTSVLELVVVWLVPGPDLVLTT